MVLAIPELLELDRIGRALSREDPELAEVLRRPLTCPRQLWNVLSLVALALCAALLCAGIVLHRDIAVFAGELVLMTVCPLLLIMARKRKARSDDADR